jgi:tetratricopeptide (TPR) repeat protein
MALNPVEWRLVELREHWEKFRADRSKRLLIWQIPDDASRMVECFFEAQKYETPYTAGDLFVVFNSPFENSIQYSRALKEELVGQYEASKEDLKQQGIAPDWAGAADAFADSPGGFIKTMCSFGSVHHRTIGHLVVVLKPQAVARDVAFASWVSRLLDTQLPDRLRVAVIELDQTPRLTTLIDAANPIVYVDKPNIDALATAEETFAQEGAVGPAGVFRNFLMGLVSLVEKGSAEQVKIKAADALAFARKQNWADQEVVIGMLVAGALLKEQQLDQAAKQYQDSRQAALQTVLAGHPAGQQLVLQTWFGEAAAHLAAGKVSEAASCYDQAGLLADAIPNIILSIEAYRMGGFCHARINAREEAMVRFAKALDVGNRLKPEARVMTTLPLVGIDLLRVVEPERVKTMEDVKYRLGIRIDEMTAKAEQSAIAMEKKPGTDGYLRIETELATGTESTQQEAAKEIELLVKASSEKFRDLYSKAKQVLGPEWPLAHLMPVSRQVKTAASAEGVVAA